MYWTFKIANGPTGQITAAICVGQNIYCFGDMQNIEHRILPGSPRDYLDLFILNTLALRWTRMPNINDENGAPLYYPEVPSRRSGSSAVAYEDKIYIFCWPNAALYCFDTARLRWSRPPVTGTIPEAYYGDRACVVRHCMYIFRPFDGATDRPIPFVDLRTFEWRSLRTTDQPKRCRTHVSIDERIYVFERNFLNYAQIVYLDINTGQWHRPTASGDRPPFPFIQSMFVHNGLIYIFEYLYMYIFDPKSNFWRTVRARGVRPRAIREYLCVMKDTQMFFLGNGIFRGIGSYRHTRILDCQPSLRSFAILAVVQHDLDTSCLPRMLQEEVRAQSCTRNSH